MKHLIITGEQQSGKTELGQYLDSIIKPPYVINDGCTLEHIKKRITIVDERLDRATFIFITNDNVEYGRHITPDKFLIIKLQKI